MLLGSVPSAAAAPFASVPRCCPALPCSPDNHILNCGVSHCRSMQEKLKDWGMPAALAMQIQLNFVIVTPVVVMFSVSVTLS